MKKLIFLCIPMKPAEEECGGDAMLAELKKTAEKPAEEILNHLAARADEFAAGAKRRADLTMIIVKIIRLSRRFATVDKSF